MKTGVLIAAVIALATLGGVFAVTRKPSAPSVPTTNTNTAQTTKEPTLPDNTSTATITYTDNGFSPSTLTVKAGTTITIKNDSSGLLQFDSDPHPEHTNNPELNAGTISLGQSETITPTKTGSHGYHNHLNPDDTGTLLVE